MSVDALQEHEHRHICLITPGHLSTNPRLVKEADTLIGAGYQVSVISADYLDWAHQADRIFSSRAWHQVARLPFGPRAPFLLRVFQVFRQRLGLFLFRVGVRWPGLVIAAWHPIGPDLVATAKTVKADIYIAHYPAALPAAALAAQHHGARYAFDAEDFHLGDPPENTSYDEIRAMIRAIESTYLPSCAYVSAASPGIADAYVAAYGLSRPTVLLNVFPLSQAPTTSTPAGSANPGPSLYWFSQTIGSDRGLECAVRALGLANSNPHLYLRGNPQPDFVVKLRAMAASVGVADRLHILPPAMPSEMERLAADYDLGLVGETGGTPNHRIALANKLFSYALAGVPALISDIPAHCEYAQWAGNAVRVFPVNDAAALAILIDEWLEGDGTKLAVARVDAFSLGQMSMNWDVEQIKFLQKVRYFLH